MSVDGALNLSKYSLRIPRCQPQNPHNLLTLLLPPHGGVRRAREKKRFIAYFRATTASRCAL